MPKFYKHFMRAYIRETKQDKNYVSTHVFKSVIESDCTITSTRELRDGSAQNFGVFFSMLCMYISCVDLCVHVFMNPMLS